MDLNISVSLIGIKSSEWPNFIDYVEYIMLNTFLCVYKNQISRLIKFRTFHLKKKSDQVSIRFCGIILGRIVYNSFSECIWTAL